ncbi:hypothetical protein AQUCO_11200001v1 [Aquilegia coerulea]|uniref:MADS-box protein AGL82 n=1 Tax=Aquilegia coerulea TaxID=218851 RepID=K7XJ86_AQUCA|nr:MADS-box protein AGL82 [Aquilegia coerulea]PIA25490.1 hypothetical protein AQUCO_11200001v1 [Aquilegia coerulea]
MSSRSRSSSSSLPLNLKKKVKLAWMRDHVARKNSCRRKKNNLVKKVDELSKLCVVKACAIYTPYDPIPSVWPSNDEARRLFLQFLTLPDNMQTEKLFNLELFLKQEIVKLEGKLERAEESEREEEMIDLIIRSVNGEVLHGLKHEDVQDMERYIEQRMKKIYERGNEQSNRGYYCRMVKDPIEANQF